MQYQGLQNGMGKRSSLNCTQRQAGKVPLWVLILLSIFSGLLMYWYTTPQEVPAWARHWLPGLPEYTGPLYRWRDDQGREQVTDKPPKGRSYETVNYRSDANVVPPQGGASRP
ncbi:MAG: DUF4124 domain-containing protein [Candidatus Competibacteraceae bacterium]|uniref:DUF4124 domain-containing protein n=1 Tax=Candidatus Contendobacter odensis Run_B_J11 TaxID=1400861 RepID=A0A7U7J4J8_9GAMM|nr:DUF4124 domain-containing protein [Candidatus Contendobacter odensis]MBK8534083.1 DUF4124 domain-containing protein [Candidatus Competibacteraceae bacterium]MBK8752136.1 DUF4124 domain-containing protein [Candidatus Competibacteraceae bacterium]CDH46340.1 hypothetical protein BN874_420053 [Candidatus Contendobacter odensis Run_B_J11]